MSYEKEIDENIMEENKMYIEMSTVEELEEEVFMAEIMEQYDKVYQKIHEGIKIAKKLEYMSDSGYIWSFKRQEKLIFETVVPGEKKGEYIRKYYYLAREIMLPSFLMNVRSCMGGASPSLTISAIF